MNNPFKQIFSDEAKSKHDNIKKMYQKKISSKAWEISKLVMMRKLTLKHITELDLLYTQYFLKYPNPKEEKSCDERIKQLKTMCKGR